jgi:hypothetical protein
MARAKRHLALAAGLAAWLAEREHSLACSTKFTGVKCPSPLTAITALTLT